MLLRSSSDPGYTKVYVIGVKIVTKGFIVDGPLLKQDCGFLHLIPDRIVKDCGFCSGHKSTSLLMYSRSSTHSEKQVDSVRGSNGILCNISKN